MIDPNSFWTTAGFEQQGVKLEEQENVIGRWDNFSLSIPKLNFGKIGTMVLTNKRLLFLRYKCKVAHVLRFPVSSVNTIGFQLNGTQYGCCKITSIYSEDCSVQGNQISIVEFSSQIIANHPLRPCVNVVSPIIMPKSSSSSTRGSFNGIKGIAEAQKQEIQDNNEQIGRTKDIKILRKNAEKMIKLANELSAVADDDESTSKMKEIYIDMGLSNAVTKEESGSKFHLDLAKEFSIAMKRALKTPIFNGIISVPEAYAIYCKARVDNFVSPDDFNEAIKIIQKGSQPYDVKVEAVNSIKYVCLNEVSFQAAGRIMDNLKNDEYLTPMKLGQQIKLPTIVAKDYLNRGVSQKLLVVDESLAGSRYYKNRFPEFNPIEL